MRNLILLITAITLFHCSCSDKGTNPPDDPDTTSHNFSWEIFEFPTEQLQGGNYFWDCFAVSDSNVWAVGQIYVDSIDSNENYIEPYNAAHWDGSRWTLKRFTYNQDIVVKPIRGIWYFSDDNIWFAAGSIFHFNGETTSLIYRPDLGNSESIEHLWAFSEDEIYAVGTKGLIMRYNGSSWNKMESGTAMDFKDIWGVVDQETEDVEVWTVGYDLTSERHGIILKYDGTIWKTVFDKDNNIYDPDSDHTVPTAVWGFKDSVYVSLSGVDDSNIMQHSRLDFSTEFRIIHNEDQGAIQSIHGSSFTDFFLVGFNDVVLHYNGSSIKKYFDSVYIEALYRKVQHTENKVFICGNIFTSSSAVLLNGVR